MYAVDSNVLLRYLLDDDKDQAAAARRLMAHAEEALVTDVVLAEVLWTLGGRKYRASRVDIESVVDALFQDSAIQFEDNRAMWRAFQDFKQTEADLQDALILRKAQAHASKASKPFHGLYTFDANALGLPATRRPDPAASS